MKSKKTINMENKKIIKELNDFKNSCIEKKIEDLGDYLKFYKDNENTIKMIYAFKRVFNDNQLISCSPIVEINTNFLNKE